MAKASLKLSNGTAVEIEGSPEEVRQLLELYGGGKPQVGIGVKLRRRETVAKEKAGKKDIAKEQIDLFEIVNLVKNCDEAEAIETQILDRVSQVNRALLPLYIVHESMGNEFSLTTGEISKITTDLGIPMRQPNIARTLSGSARGYVIGDKVRSKGQIVRYKLSRRGVKYLKEILKGAKRGE